MGANPTPTSTGNLTYDASGDINKLINQIYAAKPPDFNKSANSSVAPIYNPLLSDINNQENSARSTESGNEKQLTGMYGALQKAIGNEGNTIANNTAGAVSAQVNNTNNAVAAIGNNYSSAQANTAALLQKLGIQAAAPDALAKGTDQGAFLQSIVQAQGAGSAQLAQQLGTNAQNFNSAQKNIAGFEGPQQVTKLKGQLASTIAGLSSQAANYKSQAASQKLTLAQQLQDQYTSSLNNRANSLVSAFTAQQQMNAQLTAAQIAANAQTSSAQYGSNAQVNAAKIAADAQLAAAKAAADATKAAAKAKAGTAATTAASKNQTAGQKIYNYAGTIFGTDGNLASRAVTLASQVAAEKQYPTAEAFAEALAHKAGAGAQSDKLRSLAYTMWDILQTNPNLANYLANQN